MGASDELVGFVRDALGRGMTRSQVEEALGRAGWSPEQVRQALQAFADVDFPVPVPRPRPSLSAREAFTYLLLFTTLYVVAFHLGSLIFTIIDRLVPDPASAASLSSFRNAARFSASSLIVALPVFLFMSRTTSRAVERDPTARASPVRRWLTYLTLFIAACVLLGDVTSLVYNLLGGELTTRFVLKVLTVGSIAGTVFWYYVSDLRADEEPATP